MVKLTLVTDKTLLEHAYKTNERAASPASPAHSDGADSLFDEPMGSPGSSEPADADLLADLDTLHSAYTEPPRPHGLRPALRTCPPVPGLHLDPAVRLPDDLAEALFQQCLATYFREPHVNQVMLFERAAPAAEGPAGLPPFLTSLLGTLAALLAPALPAHTHALLFPRAGAPPQARQAIVNLYRPGDGIAPHVDLLDRFGDGIVGVSLGSGCAMRFRRATPDAPVQGDDAVDDDGHAVFLPHGSVYVMSGEARYRWTHGIDKRTEDWVQDRVGSDAGRWVMRSLRVSITFRWLLPGADIVGGLPDPASSY